MRLIPSVLLVVGSILGPMALCASAALAADSSAPSCSMQPNYPVITFPDHGFRAATGVLYGGGDCGEVPPKKWKHGTSESHELFVNANGPSGSGRYWVVTIGIAEKKQSKPARGACLSTSTVAWRILEGYKRAPLPWLSDIDGDGRSELVVWDSFPLDSSSTMYGMVAWVYGLRGDSLTIDWRLSRQMARELAQTYRSNLDSMKYIADDQKAAAEALEQFADEHCTTGR